jgi:hypothetical protein
LSSFASSDSETLVNEWKAAAAKLGRTHDNDVLAIGLYCLREAGTRIESYYRAVLRHARDAQIQPPAFANALQEAGFPASRVSEFRRLLVAPSSVMEPFLSQGQGFRATLRAARSASPRRPGGSDAPAPAQPAPPVPEGGYGPPDFGIPGAEIALSSFTGEDGKPYVHLVATLPARTASLHGRTVSIKTEPTTKAPVSWVFSIQQA